MKPSKIKFSIIVPIYNVENHLCECVDSILSQSYNDMELLLIDDGSPDRCGEICDEYHKKNSDIVKVIHTENQGVFMARSEGIKAATGDYLLFVDSDDIIRENCLEIIAGAIEESQCDIVMWNYSKNKDFSDCIKFPIVGKLSGSAMHEQLHELMATTNSLNHLCNKAFSSKIINPNYDYTKYKSCHSGEDLILCFEFIENAQSMLFIEDCLYFYRPNDESITHDFKPNVYYSLLMAYQFMEDNYQKWNFDPELKKRVYSKRLKSIYSVVTRMLLSNISDNEKRSLLQEIEKEPLFTSAYQTADLSLIPKKKLFVVNLLYKRKTGTIMLMGKIIKMIKT